MKKRVARGKSLPRVYFRIFHCLCHSLYFQCQFVYYIFRTSQPFLMKSILIFVLLLSTFILVNQTDAQGGSPAASIGAYLTLFKERKRIKALKAQQKRDKAKKTTRRIAQTPNFDRYQDCFYGPCRQSY